MYVTTEFRPSPSFLQPTSKPKGVAAGRNPNPFVFGRSRCRRSAPRSWTRHHQANNPPISNLPLLMMFPPQPRRFCRSQSGIAGCSSAATFPRTHPRAPTPPASTPRPRSSRRHRAAPCPVLPRVPTKPTPTPTTPRGALPRAAPCPHPAHAHPDYTVAAAACLDPLAHALPDDTPRPTRCGGNQPPWRHPAACRGEGAKELLRAAAHSRSEPRAARQDGGPRRGRQGAVACGRSRSERAPRSSARWRPAARASSRVSRPPRPRSPPTAPATHAARRQPAGADRRGAISYTIAQNPDAGGRWRRSPNTTSSFSQIPHLLHAFVLGLGAPSHFPLSLRK